MFRGDEDRLKQALINLVDNGLRHAVTGGRVTISAAKGKREAHVSVADNGPGISDEDLPYIFERFWRGDKSRSRHNGGSGLGLSIVRQIVELHRGTITVASPDGGGTRFTVSLPLE
jgi:two-component system sensor histidine kinase ResE